MNDSDSFVERVPQILMAHGGGGKKMNELIDELFLPAFGNPSLNKRHDGAVLDRNHENGQPVLTTDSYVVTPLFFPGGNIGDLAVHGTVNDLAMCGATPEYLSAGFILQEGFPTELLGTIVESMKKRAEETGVELVTGDTKVVEARDSEGVYINTTGVGRVREGVELDPDRIVPGDVILVNGDIGKHGMTIMARREGLNLETEIRSDTMPVHTVIEDLLRADIPVHCARDLTRGGLASASIELAETGQRQFTIHEREVPVSEAVRGACELLGMDPEHVACEGRCIVFVPRDEADRALDVMNENPQAPEPAIIGAVSDERPGTVVMEGPIGGSRFLEMPGGEQLPRIC